MHSPVPTTFRRTRRAFSLVEVTLAIGLLAFCMIPLLGLIPTGLNAQHSAAESSAAADALKMLTTAVNNSQLFSMSADGVPTYRLPQYLSDSPTPETDPTTYTVGAPASSYTYAVLDDGSIRKSNDQRHARLTMYVKTFPPASDAQLASPPTGTAIAPSAAVRVSAIVAWPSLPTDAPGMTVDKLKNRQGFLEAYITYVPDPHPNN